MDERVKSYKVSLGADVFIDNGLRGNTSFTPPLSTPLNSGAVDLDDSFITQLHTAMAKVNSSVRYNIH